MGRVLIPPRRRAGSKAQRINGWLLRKVKETAGTPSTLAQEASVELGFAVTVVDVREGFLTAERFPGATLVSAHFSRFAETVPLDARSFVVIMNHHLERDERSLSCALASEARYIGVLGPRRRYLTLMERLRANGAAFDAASLTRVRSPVGLALGAETPEEIAVSIVGEIIAVLRGFDAGFLAGREGSLHAPDNHALARS